MSRFTPLVGLLALTVATAGSGQSIPGGAAAEDAARLDPRVERLPEGRVRTLLSRLPADQLRLITTAAEEELAEVEARERAGDLTETQAGAELEEVLGLRAALIVASGQRAQALTIAPELRLFRSSEFVTAAYASEASGSLVGSTLREEARRERVEALIGLSPWIYEPLIPCNETQIRDRHRLGICIDRSSYRSVAGVAWDNGGTLQIECSAQFLDSRFLVTADHCFLTHGAVKPTVLTHYTGGAARARRAGETRMFSGLRVHAVKSVFRIPSVPHSGLDLRDFDLAVIELEEAAPVAGFPPAAPAFPARPKMTLAGWGLADADPVNDVALEVTRIEPRGPAIFSLEPPTLRTWPAHLADGGGICRGDSGGPVFVGDPSGQSPATLPLLGLVAGGNINCVSGRQALTDLTRAEARSFICRHAISSRFCS